MRAIGRELTLLTGVEQHLSLLSKSRESEEYSAFLATIVMDKEYHLQYYNLLRLLSYSYGCIMTSYSLCLKQLDTADLSLYTFFSKQLLLFDVFRFAGAFFTVAVTVFFPENSSRNARYSDAPHTYATSALNAVISP